MIYFVTGLSEFSNQSYSNHIRNYTGFFVRAISLVKSISVCNHRHLRCLTSPGDPKEKGLLKRVAGLLFSKKKYGNIKMDAAFLY